MLSDIEIARNATKSPIFDIAAKLDLSPEEVLPYGHDKAKITHEAVAARSDVGYDAIRHTRPASTDTDALGDEESQ